MPFNLSSLRPSVCGNRFSRWACASEVWERTKDRRGSDCFNVGGVIVVEVLEVVVVVAVAVFVGSKGADQVRVTPGVANVSTDILSSKTHLLSILLRSNSE